MNRKFISLGSGGLSLLNFYFGGFYVFLSIRKPKESLETQIRARVELCLNADKTDLQALYLSGTYCHRTGTRPPICAKPRQPTMYTAPYVPRPRGIYTVLDKIQALPGPYKLSII